MRTLLNVIKIFKHMKPIVIFNFIHTETVRLYHLDFRETKILKNILKFNIILKINTAMHTVNLESMLFLHEITPILNRLVDYLHQAMCYNWAWVCHHNSHTSTASKQ
jgi:hypothetical protein